MTYDISAAAKKLVQRIEATPPDQREAVAVQFLAAAHIHGIIDNEIDAPRPKAMLRGWANDWNPV